MKKQALDVFNSEGLRELISRGVKEGLRRITHRSRRIYSSVRSKTAISNSTAIYNSVKVQPHRRLDSFAPDWVLTPNQGGHKAPQRYECGLVSALKTHVERGDHVVVVGGGLGVTATIAARCVGKSGRVTVYEASNLMIEHLRRTIQLNDVADRVDIKHAIVSEAVSTEGWVGDAAVISPADLPSFDVLEMDCEGAETSILPELNKTARKLLIETHGNIDQVRDQLDTLGYTVLSDRLAEAGPYEKMCLNSDIRVLVAGK